MNALIMHAHACKLRDANPNCCSNARNYAYNHKIRRICTYDKSIDRKRLSNSSNLNYRTGKLRAASSSTFNGNDQLCEGLRELSSNHNSYISTKALQVGVIEGKAQESKEYVAASPQSVSSPGSTLVREKLSSSPAEESKGAGFVEWEATVVIEKQNFLDLNNIVADVGDKISELFGSRIYLQLVSSTSIDPESGEGRRSEKAYVEGWFWKAIRLRADDGSSYKVQLKVDQQFGKPAAILVENEHPNAFRLRSVSLSSASTSQPVKFVCNSWVYSPSLSNGARIFFSDQCYLPGETPEGIKKLRSQELQNKRGDGTGTRVTSDRIYDFTVYNDLGNPDKSADYARPVLGGTEEYPYPRRCRTGRSSTETDPNAESPLNILGNVYVPRDEQFDRVKLSDFFGSGLKSVLHALLPTFRLLISFTRDYKSYDQVYGLYSKGSIKSLREDIDAPPIEDFNGTPPLELFRQLTDPRGGDTFIFRFPVPQIIQVNERIWCDDSEFARQLLVGVNPVVVQRLKVFPPTSNLDSDTYGSKISTITAEQIEGSLEGMTVDEALRQNKLYTLDYHDVYMPYIERINKLKGKFYASRSLFFLAGNGTLRPLAIELSLPPSDGKPATNKVLLPPKSSRERDLLWELAKLHVMFNDTGYHELVSHWLRSHGSVEPFIIATHRQLSSMHPIYNLLFPHLKNTMNINATARNDLINSFSGSLLNGGIIEYTFTPGRYSMELSSAAYKDWRFDEQALPIDLIKRGMAEPDSSEKHGLRLLIKDYPFAVDALDVWAAMSSWAEDYVNIFYADDASVVNDVELQEWWSEARYKGHADKADEEWWPKLTGRAELAKVATTIMWMASGHHAAVNFGQFGYGGFPLSRATLGRRFLPEEGSQEYRELIEDPDKFYFKTMSPVFQSLVVIATLEILSNHSANEEYLGQAVAYEGVAASSAKVRAALQKFQERLKEAEEEIIKRNADPHLLNRCGRSAILYTIMMPSSPKPGLSGRGIPNSISI